jgi:hypothetical protein
MSQKPSKQPSTNGGEGMNSGGIIFFVIAGLLYIGALALWSRFHTEMSAAYGGWRQIQLFLFHLVGGTPLADWFTFFKESDPALVGFSHWTESSKGIWDGRSGLEPVEMRKFCPSRMISPPSRVVIRILFVVRNFAVP